MKSAFYILTVFKNGFSQTRDNLNGILKNNLQKPRLEKNTNLNIQILIISSFCKQQVSKGPILQNFNVFCLRDNNLKLLESPGRHGTSTNLSCPNLSRCNVSIFPLLLESSLRYIVQNVSQCWSSAFLHVRLQILVSWIYMRINATIIVCKPCKCIQLDYKI